MRAKKLQAICHYYIRKFSVKLLSVFILIILLSACKTSDQSQKPVSVIDIHSPQPTAQITPRITSAPTQVELVAVGDNLIHEPIYNEAKEITNNKGYNFEPAYAHVADFIKKADIAFLNQETPLAGTAFGISAYPQFNSPQELGDHMATMGFDVINMANNHVLDKREAGMISTLKFWEKYKDIKVIGAAKTKQQSEEIQIVERNGIKFSFLGFTYGTNGFFLQDNSTAVICYITDEIIIAKIKEAKNISDIVVVSMHWGNENKLLPSVEQRRLAKVIADAGADVIIGHHPHVIEPIEYIDRANGGKTLVVYSLGNFISTQKEAANMLGGIVSIVFEENREISEVGFGKAKISKVKFIPIITHYDSRFRQIAAYPFSEYTRELASLHGVVKYDSLFSYDFIQSLINKTISEDYLK